MAVKEKNRLVATNGNGEHAAVLPVSIPVNIPRLDLRKFEVTLQGTSPLVVHAWSAKAQQEMLDKQTGKAKQGRAKKDPVACFKETLYRMPGGEGFGFPVIGFKSAAVDAANYCELKKTEMRGSFHVKGDLVRIEAPAITEPITEQDREYRDQIKEEHKYGASMRMDMVRIAMGTSDIRFRAQFLTWEVRLLVEYNHSVINTDQIINLFNTAGFAVGVGEHRPQKDGSWGMFKVV